jgi:hypothetical protein
VTCVHVCEFSKTRVSFKSLYILRLTLGAANIQDGSGMFDPATLVIIGTGSSSLFVAFVEYVYGRRKRAVEPRASA